MKLLLGSSLNRTRRQGALTLHHCSIPCSLRVWSKERRGFLIDESLAGLRCLTPLLRVFLQAADHSAPDRVVGGNLGFFCIAQREHPRFFLELGTESRTLGGKSFNEIPHLSFLHSGGLNERVLLFQFFFLFW